MKNLKEEIQSIRYFFNGYFRKNREDRGKEIIKD